MNFSVRGLLLLTALAALASWLVVNSILVREVLTLSLLAMSCLAAVGSVRLVQALRRRITDPRHGR